MEHYGPKMRLLYTNTSQIVKQDSKKKAWNDLLLMFFQDLLLPFVSKKP